MSYKAGIVKAIDELKDRSGSSMIAIKKHMQANLPKDKKWMNSTFLTALKSGVASGDFVQVKNSYKLSPEFKKKRIAAEKKASAPKKKAAPKKKVVPKKKKTAAKKKVAPKKTSTKKKTAPKKKTTKKVASKKKTSTKKKSKKASKK
mmetsp:Transcript_9208/g.17238  ORF Transcript_9208/g.17238 Transcript_9208/m.17238 type:complete len:147 (-) Transcript_9208:167-607(-)